MHKIWRRDREINYWMAQHVRSRINSTLNINAIHDLAWALLKESHKVMLSRTPNLFIVMPPSNHNLKKLLTKKVIEPKKYCVGSTLRVSATNSKILNNA